MLKTAMVVVLSCGALSFGCGSEERDIAAENQEIIDNLVKAGFPDNDIMVVDDVVYVGRDAEVSLEASREMVSGDSDTEEQYRTTNLVSRSLRTICVNGAAFTGSFSTALNNAIGNYNALGLTFTMRRTSSQNASGCNATIRARVSSGTGGSSGFPSGGVPFNTINIGSGLNGFAVSTITHVITHELGHTVGFRHSDYFNRSISCGTGGNEGQAGVGAILVPGTPSGATVGGSVMNSCFRTVETGRFTSTDITALQTLY